MKYFFITHIKQRHKLGPVPTYLHILSICNLKFCSVNFAKFCKFCKFAGRKCCVNTKNWRAGFLITILIWGKKVQKYPEKVYFCFLGKMKVKIFGVRD